MYHSGSILLPYGTCNYLYKAGRLPLDYGKDQGRNGPQKEVALLTEDTCSMCYCTEEDRFSQVLSSEQFPTGAAKDSGKYWNVSECV